MILPFETADVFATNRFGGNPLAVVHDADALDTAAMQAVAREFNLAETVFVLHPDRSDAEARIRIFTPAAELPFAGHPNVGAAALIAQRRGLSAEGLVLDQAAGPVAGKILRADGRIVGAEVEAPVTWARGETRDPAAMAACAGLAPADIRTDHHPPLLASVGVPSVLCELESEDALADATPDIAAFRAHLPLHPGAPSALHLYVRCADGTLNTRMFAPLAGIPEDPATGSANASLAGLLLHLAGEEVKELRLAVRQGEAMGRPSRLDLHARRTPEGIRVRLGGRVVPVARGEIRVA